MSTLEGCLGEDLDPKAPRPTAVLPPLKLIIDDFPENLSEIGVRVNLFLRSGVPALPSISQEAMPASMTLIHFRLLMPS
jgi:hypothetical protein